jgi:hypothetical protein
MWSFCVFASGVFFASLFSAAVNEESGWTERGTEAMTSNGVAGGAIQTLSAVPPERVSEHTTVKTVKAQKLEPKVEDARVNEPARQIPVQVYNSHGEVIPSPSSPETDMTA